MLLNWSWQRIQFHLNLSIVVASHLFLSHFVRKNWRSQIQTSFLFKLLQIHLLVGVKRPVVLQVDILMLRPHVVQPLFHELVSFISLLLYHRYDFRKSLWKHFTIDFQYFCLTGYHLHRVLIWSWVNEFVFTDDIFILYLHHIVDFCPCSVVFIKELRPLWDHGSSRHDEEEVLLAALSLSILEQQHRVLLEGQFLNTFWSQFFDACQHIVLWELWYAWAQEAWNMLLLNSQFLALNDSKDVLFKLQENTVGLAHVCMRPYVLVTRLGAYWAYQGARICRWYSSSLAIFDNDHIFVYF